MNDVQCDHKKDGYADSERPFDITWKVGEIKDAARNQPEQVAADYISGFCRLGIWHGKSYTGGGAYGTDKYHFFFSECEDKY